MALRVAGDPDLLELVAELVERRQQRERVGEPADRLAVAADHEDVADGRGLEPAQDLLGVLLVRDQPRSDVWDDVEAGCRQPLGDVERGVEPASSARP